jgi:tRNA-modifying protein YgfZ
MNLFTPLLVSGPDARTYLQGQLTCDMDQLTRDNSLLACCNSAQGRVQAVLTVMERDEGIVLVVATAIAEQTIQRLRKYVLRSKVKIELIDSSPTTAPLILSLSKDSPQSMTYMDVGNAGLVGNIDRPASLLSQLRAGIPHVFPETHEAFVAQMLNLDVLGGISFEKGCYTGQEIIARAHFRGAVKRRMFRFTATCAPPAPGTRLFVGSEPAGDVVYAAATEQGCELLAVVSLTHAESRMHLETQPNASLTKQTLPYAV